jgi:hypothetical protein
MPSPRLPAALLAILSTLSSHTRSRPSTRQPEAARPSACRPTAAARRGLPLHLPPPPLALPCDGSPTMVSTDHLHQQHSAATFLHSFAFM